MAERFLSARPHGPKPPAETTGNSCQGRPLDPLRKAERDSMARPRLDEQERRARTVGVRVTAAEATELRERAQAARLSMGAYLRRRALAAERLWVPPRCWIFREEKD